MKIYTYTYQYNIYTYTYIYINMCVCVPRNVSDSWLHGESGGKLWHIYQPYCVRCAHCLGRRLGSLQRRKVSSRCVLDDYAMVPEYEHVCWSTCIIMYVYMCAKSSGPRVPTPDRRCGMHCCWKWGGLRKGKARPARNRNIPGKGILCDVLWHCSALFVYKSCHAVSDGPLPLCHTDECVMALVWLRITSLQVTRNNPVLTRECPKTARGQGRVAANWTMKECKLSLSWRHWECIAMCDWISIELDEMLEWLYGHVFQTGQDVLGADTQCMHESMHTCYSKWIEDYIQTLLDHLPLGMKMHRWNSYACVLHACATLREDYMLVSDK